MKLEENMFQLTKDEYYNILRSQIGTLELKQGQYNILVRIQ